MGHVKKSFDHDARAAAFAEYMAPLDPKYEAEAFVFEALADDSLRDRSDLATEFDRALRVLGAAAVLLRPPFVLPTQRQQRVERIARRAIDALREDLDEIEWSALVGFVDVVATSRRDSATKQTAPRDARAAAAKVLRLLAMRYESFARVLADHYVDDVEAIMKARHKGHGGAELAKLHADYFGKPAPTRAAVRQRRRRNQT